MSFREVVTWPLRQVDRLNPLGAASGVMLRHVPTLWRVSVLKIVWYLLLAHLGLWWAGWAAARSMTHVPTLREMLALQGTITLLAVMIGFAWVVSVWQTPLIRRSAGTILLTWVVYAGFIYGLATTTQAYVAPVSHKVTHIYDRKHLDEDAAALADPFAHICGQKGAGDPRAAVARLYRGHPDHDRLSDVMDTLYKVAPVDCDALRDVPLPEDAGAPVSLRVILGDLSPFPSSLVELHEAYRAFIYRVNDRLEADFPPRLDSTTRNPGLGVTQIESRLAAARLAHATCHPRHDLHYVMNILRPEAAILAVVLASFLMVLDLHGRRWWAAALEPLDRMQSRRQARPGLISRLNARFLRTRPVLWQLRLPAAAGLMLFVVVFGWVAIDLTENLVFWTVDMLGERFTADFVEIAVFLAYGLIAVSIPIAVMQVQRRYFQLDLLRPGAGAQFFLALFLPLLAACLAGSAMTVFEIGDRATGNGVVWFLAAIFAYLAATFSWSQTFLGLRAAIFHAIVFAAFCGVVGYVLASIDDIDELLELGAFIILGAVILTSILGRVGRLGWLRWPVLITLSVYGCFFSTVAVVILIENLYHEAVPLEWRALVINGVFLMLALLLSPLLNRLQEITMAPQP